MLCVAPVVCGKAGGLSAINQIDIIVAAIFGLGIISGIQKGLIKALGSLLAWIVSFWAAWHFRLPLIYFLENRWALVSTLEQWLLTHIPFLRLTQSVVVVGAPGEPEQYQFWLDQLKALFLPPTSTMIAPAQQLAMILLSVAAFFLIFVLARLATNLIFHFLQLIVDYTPLKLLNHSLGAVLGGLEAALFSFLLFFILTPILSTGALMGWVWSTALMQMLSGSFFYQLSLQVLATLRAWF
jgi:uncharacterized membrane protein required for colicin V production